jgi:hypothetical protein
MEWISLKSRLPEENEEVLILKIEYKQPGSYFTNKTYRGDNWSNWDKEFYLSDQCIKVYDVYWIPMPTMPKK